MAKDAVESYLSDVNFGVLQIHGIFNSGVRRYGDGGAVARPVKRRTWPTAALSQLDFGLIGEKVGREPPYTWKASCNIPTTIHLE
jgi:hypothetical protein